MKLERVANALLDRLEAEHKEAMKTTRLAAAKASRQRTKAFKESSHVILSGLNGKYTNNKGYTPNKKNGTKVSKDAFYKLLAKLSKREAKTVRKKSIDATLKTVEEKAVEQTSHLKLVK